MPRTTDSSVEGVLGNDYDGTTDLAQFIETATVIVDRVSACAIKKGKALSSTELELIERWLSAHYYACSDQPFTSKSTGGASASFQGQTAMSLEGTKYGQVSLNLDYSGCLTSIAKRQVASGVWLGKTPSEQLPFYQRD